MLLCNHVPGFESNSVQGLTAHAVAASSCTSSAVTSAAYYVEVRVKQYENVQHMPAHCMHMHAWCKHFACHLLHIDEEIAEANIECLYVLTHRSQ